MLENKVYEEYVFATNFSYYAFQHMTKFELID